MKTRSGRAVVLAAGLALAFAPTFAARAQDDGDAPSADATADATDSLMATPDPSAALADPGAGQTFAATPATDDNAFVAQTAASTDDGTFPAETPANPFTATAQNAPVVCWPDVDENGFPTEQCSDGQGPLWDQGDQPQPAPQPTWWQSFKSLWG